MPHIDGLTRMYYGAYQFMPVPMFSWATELVRDGKGSPLSLRHTLDFAGNLLESDPGESGVFPYMMSEREKLQLALTASGTQQWRITYAGAPVISGVYPKVSNVEFAEGQWVDRIDYTFTMTYDEALPSGAAVNSFSENWQFEENEDRRTYKATHDISAVGINTATVGNNALTNARSFVSARIGYNNIPPGLPAFVVASGSGLAGYEELRSENADVQGGSYGLTEVFTISSGNFTHLTTAQFNTDANGITQVSLEGTIQGLGRGDSAYPRALNAWNTQVKPALPGIASSVYSAFGGSSSLIVSKSESLSITRNQIAGSITYSTTYTDDATKATPSGIQDSTLTVTDDKPQRLYASFPIMDRAAGNIVQEIGTTTEGSYTVAGSVIGKQGYPFANVVAYAESLVSLNLPSMSTQTIRMDKKSVTKDEAKNTISFSITWIYTWAMNQITGDSDLD